MPLISHCLLLEYWAQPPFSFLRSCWALSLYVLITYSYPKDLEKIVLFFKKTFKDVLFNALYCIYLFLCSHSIHMTFIQWAAGISTTRRHRALNISTGHLTLTIHHHTVDTIGHPLASLRGTLGQHQRLGITAGHQALGSTKHCMSLSGTKQRAPPGNGH